MSICDLGVYGVTICGSHPDFITKRYYGVASNIDQAMNMANAKAISDGWTQIDYDDVTKIGSLSFIPCMTGQESEDLKCQS